MTRRIDIELTSSRDDGTWTWRAPGARQPRGSLEGTLLPEGAKVGDVLRADAEFDLEGIVVTSVLAPKDSHHGREGGPHRDRGLGPRQWPRGVCRWSSRPEGAAATKTDGAIAPDGPRPGRGAPLDATAPRRPRESRATHRPGATPPRARRPAAARRPGHPARS